MGEKTAPTKTIKRNKLEINSQAGGRGGGGKCRKLVQTKCKRTSDVNNVMVSDRKGRAHGNNTTSGTPQILIGWKQDRLGTCRLSLQTIIKCLAIKSHYDVVITVSFLLFETLIPVSYVSATYFPRRIVLDLYLFTV